MKGKILKVTLTNFITYEYLELVPGPHMNMIIGPNGSGKSSILCGLCLGLGGKTSSIGRVTKLSEYIKTGCNSATIEIELQNDRNVAVVTRILNRGATDTSGGTSVWSLNGKTTNLKEVENFVKSMNIHMDNLCQFLSQERVQDFTKMNSKELLVNTEKTVGTSDLYESHQALIEMSKSGGGQEKELDATQKSLDNNNQKLETLKQKMESMKERLALVKQIDNVKAKIPWIEYNDQVDRVAEVKRDRENALEKLESMDAELKPIEKSVNELNSRLKQLKSELSSRASGPAVMLRKFFEDQNKIQVEMARNTTSLKSIENQEKKFQTELAFLEQKIGSNRERLDQMESEIDRETQRQQIDSCNREIKELDGNLSNVHKRCSELQNKIRDISSEIRALDHEKAQQSSVAQKRMNSLSFMCKRSYNASHYLKTELSRTTTFRGNVYPSIMLEINMTDPRASKYINSLISRRDKTAFLCESYDDLNKIFPLLKSKFGALNMLQQSKDVGISMEHPVDMRSLKRMGFDDYLSNLISCPVEIFNYLCKNYRIHQIPVAYREGSVNENEAMKSLTCFFVGDNQYRVSTSRYSNEKSTRISQVNSRNNPFADNIDQNAITNAEAKRQEKEAEKSNIDAEMKRLTGSVREQENQRDALKNKLKEIRIVEVQINELKQQIRKDESKRTSMVEHGDNFDEEKERILTLNKKYFKTLMKNMPNFKNHLHKCYQDELDKGISKIEVRGLNRKISDKTEEMNEKRRALDDFRRTVTCLEETFKRLQAEAKNLRKVAEKAIGCSPNDPAFQKIKEIFSEFPNTVIELDNMKTDLESRLEFMDGGDENVAELLDAQRKLCAELQKKLANLQDAVKNRKGRMDALKDKWLPAVEELADRISVKFERLFDYMACEGEVQLIKGHDGVEDDFENYGLSIKVSFREGQEMQELGCTQSGGERSVSTAIYLLALQELTQVPFRCLDEINQGMDGTNERRITDLMMKMSSSADSCQYFLVSPKLLPNCTFAESCRVLCVQQPPRMDTTKWTMQNFLVKKQMALGEKKMKMNGTGGKGQAAVAEESGSD